MNKVNSNFWENKKVFLTGHTGFKGSWMSLCLQSLGCKVLGYSLPPETDPNLYDIASVGNGMDQIIGDIRDAKKLIECMSEFDPDVVMHFAAQPLVRRSYLDPIETYSTNVLGTVNVLEGARQCNCLKAILIVTTDKCYENKEWVWPYKELDELGGHDPYSNSKACSELVVQSYKKSFFNSEHDPAISTARAGNVIGGGDWSKDRLLPDILRSFQNHQNVRIRNPTSIRPWQHVLEPIGGYLILLQSMLKDKKRFSGSWNFGPDEQGCKSVEWIADYLKCKWGEGADWIADNGDNPHEANILKLDCAKAKFYLDWQPKFELDTSLNLTVQWFKDYLRGENMNEVCIKDLNNYFSYDSAE